MARGEHGIGVCTRRACCHRAKPWSPKPCDIASRRAQHARKRAGGAWNVGEDLSAGRTVGSRSAVGRGDEFSAEIRGRAEVVITSVASKYATCCAEACTYVICKLSASCDHGWDVAVSHLQSWPGRHSTRASRATTRSAACRNRSARLLDMREKHAAQQ